MPPNETKFNIDSSTCRQRLSAQIETSLKMWEPVRECPSGKRVEQAGISISRWATNFYLAKNGSSKHVGFAISVT